MTQKLDPPLEILGEWVLASDGHARHRLPLLADAQHIVDGSRPAPAEERFELALRLERWRYQHLDEHRGRSNPLVRRLAEILDLASSQLAGHDRRRPRSPRDALMDSFQDTDEITRAVASLDPAAPLTELTEEASRLTRERFGRRMLLYAPLYLSSHCINHCVYCGFRYPHEIPRKHLTVDEAVDQADLLGARGLRHILLVAGDFPRLTTTAYFAEIIRALSARGLHVAIEIAPQSVASYSELVSAGACGVTLYQETYNERLYALYHPRGNKVSYDWRLEGLERAAEAGMRRIGLGILLGLADPREDLLAMLRHARYLHERFPDRTLAFSLPRIYDAPQGFEPPYPVDDETFLRLYCALRIAFPAAELVLSTREPAALRGRLAEICITQMSAGSCTVPGGYEDAGNQTRGGQFPVSDCRTPAEVAAWLSEAGFTVAWGMP